MHTYTERVRERDLYLSIIEEQSGRKVSLPCENTGTYRPRCNKPLHRYAI